ncbi:AbrB/MazE/SpoVT family DNA-binding domain-containing protein [Rhizobium alvei]|uniref:AbrB/MazE/SpoVT family DNA-binding domain-containing protein n=1 Tax=Rhizobium alvei TaxID=1132659 RepID=A0ABT8YJC4_9HYPH|nr:AbrB/MazE/SpoVT family DNA-binding domain-containing protein [Rhizobium alvei]MDO6963755.1 AbrB/MazE/SpoVT family DNA-binding domain-containing protein [Rhizobium alvei]
MNLVLRKIGNSVGVILPKEILDRFGLKEGDSLNLDTTEGILELRSSEDEFAHQVEIGRKFMDKYKVALQKLAE